MNETLHSYFVRGIFVEGVDVIICIATCRFYGWRLNCRLPLWEETHIYAELGCGCCWLLPAALAWWRSDAGWFNAVSHDPFNRIILPSASIPLCLSFTTCNLVNSVLGSLFPTHILLHHTSSFPSRFQCLSSYQGNLFKPKLDSLLPHAFNHGTWTWKVQVTNLKEKPLRKLPVKWRQESARTVNTGSCKKCPWASFWITKAPFTSSSEFPFSGIRLKQQSTTKHAAPVSYSVYRIGFGVRSQHKIPVAS